LELLVFQPQSRWLVAQAALRIRIQALVQARVSYGYLFYKQEGLLMRTRRPRRHVSACRHMERPIAHRPNESWSMDFMSDDLYNGQRLKLLTLVANFTRESLAIEVVQKWGQVQCQEL